MKPGTKVRLTPGHKVPAIGIVKGWHTKDQSVILTAKLGGYYTWNIADLEEVVETDPLKAVLEELLAYEHEAFEDDSCLDLADLCTRFGEWRVRIKNAMGIDLVGCEHDYGIRPTPAELYAKGLAANNMTAQDHLALIDDQAEEQGREPGIFP